MSSPVILATCEGFGTSRSNVIRDYAASGGSLETP
jgi:hypothetical protein